MAITSKTYQIKQYILSHPKAPTREIAEKFKTNNAYVRECRHELSKGELSLPNIHHGVAPKTIDQDLVERKRQAIIVDLQRRNQELLYRYNQISDKLDEALQITEFTEVKAPKIPVVKGTKDQAVPIIQYSDWHVEERIEKSTTGGMNEYNPDIAKARAEKLVVNTLKLIKKERQDVTINELVVCLGGDFINNYLHEHDVQMNFMSPIQASMFAKEILKKSLLTLANNANVKKILVVCVRGNHGRQTKKMSSSIDYRMNLEAIIYHSLKQELSEPFEFYIPESELAYFDVLGKKIRAFHGHQVSYQGGIGDLTVPMNKLIQKWDRTVKADWNLCHHYHRVWLPTSTCSLNGSLCGWNSYAQSIGAAFEPPMQVFHLLDAKKGFTTRMPIFCE
jgi:hypothetical protein